MAGPIQAPANNPVGAVQGNYNSAIAALQQALQASQNTTSGGMAQLQQQLQQNQGKVQQGLTNSGLGNTTVAQTMQQAPLQTYNLGALNVQNAGAQRQMGADQSLAQGYMGAGNQLGNLLWAQNQQNSQIGQANQMKPRSAMLAGPI